MKINIKEIIIKKINILKFTDKMVKSVNNSIFFDIFIYWIFKNDLLHKFINVFTLLLLLLY
jgi:hypothetical protein